MRIINIKTKWVFDEVKVGVKESQGKTYRDYN